MISLPSEIAVVVRNSELLFSQAEVVAAFDRLAKEVSQSLGESNPIVIAVMKGGLYPTAQRVASVVLVRKGHGLNRTGFEVDFCGLEVDDRCMFGCGMDYKEYLRHVPEIYAVNE